MPRGGEILDVMMSMFPGEKDDFGKEEVPPLPLSFDRVCRGHSQEPIAPLFKLPSEILDDIIHWVAPDSLSSLALVNRDCLQWARSRRFASVHLDYSNSSINLIQYLLEEASRDLSATSSYTPLPELGLCIRRITVATNPAWVAFRHGLDSSEDDVSEEERTKLMVDASSAFFDGYIPSIQQILNPLILPFWELLDWEDKIPLPQSFFEALAMSGLKYLKLFRIKLNDEFDIMARLASMTHPWPLRRLHLEFSPNIFGNRDIKTSPLSASLLRSCSRSLEDLRLTTMTSDDNYSFTDSTDDKLPQFSSLSRLSIGMVSFSDSSMLEALVGKNLRYLEVGERWSPIYRDFFEKRGKVPFLQTFVWASYSQHEPPYSFLLANSQITKLAMPNAVPSTMLEMHIIPLLKKNFRNLVSLSLVWKEPSIADSAVRQICSHKTLKQIHLSAGQQYGWKHDWLIDHVTLRRYLSTVPSLERIAFSRDSYSRGEPPMRPDSYYSQFQFSDTPVEQRWENRHRRRMVGEAKKYIRLMPQLEWIYLGQLPMDVETNKDTGSRSVRLLSEERDGCRTLLRTMFGGHTY